MCGGCVGAWVSAGRRRRRRTDHVELVRLGDDHRVLGVAGARGHRRDRDEEVAQLLLRAADVLVHDFGAGDQRRRPPREAGGEARGEERLAAAGRAVEQQPLQPLRTELVEQRLRRAQRHPHAAADLLERVVEPADAVGDVRPHVEVERAVLRRELGGARALLEPVAHLLLRRAPRLRHQVRPRVVLRALGRHQRRLELVLARLELGGKLVLALLARRLVLLLRDLLLQHRLHRARQPPLAVELLPVAQRDVGRLVLVVGRADRHLELVDVVGVEADPRVERLLEGKHKAVEVHLRLAVKRHARQVAQVLERRRVVVPVHVVRVLLRELRHRDDGVLQREAAPTQRSGAPGGPRRRVRQPAQRRARGTWRAQREVVEKVPESRAMLRLARSIRAVFTQNIDEV